VKQFAGWKRGFPILHINAAYVLVRRTAAMLYSPNVQA
jgi:hypothetical protein